ncbi:MAG: DUF222 domain-containing protein [Streptosporangiales bacterium]|nr:DUF222 domain-containing protein [Streptosporangiales bacterium]
MVRICDIALRQVGKVPDTHGEPTQVRALVPLSTLQLEDGSPAMETDWGQVLPAPAARMLSCDSVLRRIVTDPLTGMPLDVGKPTRTIPLHVRIAVTAKYRTCQWPGGCDMPVPWCDVHHLMHFADGGLATLDNLTVYCRVHHTHQHIRDQTEHRQHRKAA